MISPATADRFFQLGREIAEDDPYFKYLDGENDRSVYVELQDGTVHRHMGGSYRRLDPGADQAASFLDAASYFVLESGALAITATRMWTSGHRGGVNDVSRIVRTYAPGHWASVAGDFHDDPVKSEFKRFQRERGVRLESEGNE